MSLTDALTGDLDEALRPHWLRFRHERSPESFLALRRAVAESPGFDPDSSDLHEADDLLAQGRIAEGHAALRALMPGWLLTPRVHRMASYVYFRKDQLRSASRQILMGDVIGQGILGTGTGEKERPYLILHAIDAWDVLTQRGQVPQSYRAVDGAGPTYLFVWNCTDGTEVWFDTAAALLPAESLA